MRVAFFPCVYHEIDGVANTSRHFEAFARRRGCPFLMVHQAQETKFEPSGPVTRVQLRRGPVKFPLDRAHKYDLLFLRHFWKLESLVRSFQPQVVQITGPSDVGTLGALIAYKLGIPLAASWQTNLHQYARRRAAAAMSFIPKAASTNILDAVERMLSVLPRVSTRSLGFCSRPTRRSSRYLEEHRQTLFLDASRCGHDRFQPGVPEPQRRPVPNRLRRTAHGGKKVRSLARLEQALLAMGHRDFRIVVVGEGRQENWLRKICDKLNLPASSRAKPCHARSPTWTSWPSRRRRIRSDSLSSKRLRPGFLQLSQRAADQSTPCSMAAPDMSPTTLMSS